jgi:hypothetical protein
MPGLGCHERGVITSSKVHVFGMHVSSDAGGGGGGGGGGAFGSLDIYIITYTNEARKSREAHHQSKSLSSPAPQRYPTMLQAAIVGLLATLASITSSRADLVPRQKNPGPDIYCDHGTFAYIQDCQYHVYCVRILSLLHR